MTTKKQNPTKIEQRQSAQKAALLEILKKTPIVQAACQKANIGRATYYRWLKEDTEFADSAQAALDDGVSIVNDMAESQLISAIKDKNMTAIIFWLKHHHAAYAPRIELMAGQPKELPMLDEEQQKIVQAALEQARLLPSGDNNDAV